MRSQSPTLAKPTCSVTLSKNNIKEIKRSTTPNFIATNPKREPKLIQMTTGNGFSTNNNNNSHSTEVISLVQQNLSTCQTIPSTSSSSSNILVKKSSSTCIRNVNTNNNSSTAINNNNNNTHNSKLSTNTKLINNNIEGNNSIPNTTKLQTLEQRKIELEKLLSEKNWLLQQIHKQEAQILKGNYENLNIIEIGKLIGTSNSTGGGSSTSQTNSNTSILRRRGSSSLKLPKNNVNFNDKGNRFTLSKSEYDLAQETNKQGSTMVTASNQLYFMGSKKRQGPPQKTNSFHDSTSAASVLSLTKSPSFEHNDGNSAIIKYSFDSRPSHLYNSSSNDSLSNNFGITQCDKYYLSPTSQLYNDGNGFIKASQNIKQCLSSPSSINKMMTLTDLQQHQQIHVTTNGNHLEQYDRIDALSLPPPSSNCDQQHANFWRAFSKNDRSVWCDNSYIELENESLHEFHSIKPMAKQIIPPSCSSLNQQQNSPEYSTHENFFPVTTGGVGLGGAYPMNTNEKSCDELSISSVNNETSKKPKHKQWMESSLDGPIIRSNALQSTPLVSDGISQYQAMSPTHNPLSKMQYAFYNVSRQASATASINSVTPSGTLTPSPSVIAGNGISRNTNGMIVSATNSRLPTRTLTHHGYSQPQCSNCSNSSNNVKQGFHRERTKLSSQSMSSGSYRTAKIKLDEETSQLSHSTSYLNYDPYHHHFQQQQLQQPQQLYHQNHYHLDIPFQHQKQVQKSQTSPKAAQHPIQQSLSPSAMNSSNSLCNVNDFRRYVTPPSALSNSSLGLTTKYDPINPLPINTLPQQSPVATSSATSPDIRIESPKNMTVVQQATFLPYKEITKPFEMSDFYKYSIKFRQKDVLSATLSKN